MDEDAIRQRFEETKKRPLENETQACDDDGPQSPVAKRGVARSIINQLAGGIATFGRKLAGNNKGEEMQVANGPKTPDTKNPQ